MREIEFRGNRRDTGEWVYGGFFHYGEGAGGRFYIITKSIPPTFTFIEVIPETVGQYTGLKDKNGVKIFEGDIVRVFHFKEPNGKKHYLYHVVEWSEEYLGWIAVDSGERQNEARSRTGSPQLFVYARNVSGFEVIGNIYDNTELMEGC